jgi:membrane fusion protein (multidrug efflux system)
MKRRPTIIILTGSALVLGGVYGFSAFKAEMIKGFFSAMATKEMVVNAAQAIEMEWPVERMAVGALKARQGVEITTQMAGVVKEIRFESGQAVKKGDVLIRLDADIEQSELRSAQAELSFARSTSQRAQALAATRNIAEASVDKATADREARTAAVATLLAKIEKKTVTAPFDGALGLRKIDLGQYLQPGQVIVGLQDLTAMRVEFSVPQKDLSHLTIGQMVRIEVDAYPGKSFSGELIAVEPAVEAQSGMLKAEARLENPEGLLRPGMFVRIVLSAPVKSKTIAIPQAAISYSLSGDNVFVIEGQKDGSQTVRRVNVETGGRREGLVAVTKGLAAGAQVVTAGQIKLDNGMKVKIAESTALLHSGEMPRE